MFFVRGMKAQLATVEDSSMIRNTFLSYGMYSFDFRFHRSHTHTKHVYLYVYELIKDTVTLISS